MPVRATKRGAARTPLGRDCDVLVCGASFAGLAVARELAGSGARVLIVDRYEVGERQTSACAAPTLWLEQLGLSPSIRQTFGDLVFHTPHASLRFRLPWTFSTFDYRELCALLRDQGAEADFETAKVEGIDGGRPPGALRVVSTDRGELRALLVVDALGWRRVLGATGTVQPPDARLSRGLEVHPSGQGDDLEIWIDPRYVRAGYSWSFPAAGEMRVGVGSFEPRDRVREPTVRLAGDLGLDAVAYQGNWIPHRLRPAVEDGVFFVGDSAGHCLPLTAEGIRTAFYFGLDCGRRLRAVVAGRTDVETALAEYGGFSAGHRRQFEALLAVQHLIGRVGRRPLMTTALRAMSHPRFVRWAFSHYLAIAPPSFVRPEAGGPRASRRAPVPAAT
jgi:flavin-dependent dehydrogenase